MAKGRGGLGRGLESLFEDAAPSFEADTRIETLPLREIEPDPDQPRKTFDHDTLGELAASIAEHGLLQPIAVRAAIALSKTAEPPSSAHWRRSTNYAIARIARNMSTCRMTPNIRRNRQTNPTMPYSPPLKLAPKQTATSPPTICSI